MRFDLSSEQQALRDATRGLLERCASSHRAAMVDGDNSFDAECWRRASDELGLPGVAVPEEHDGAGGSVVDAAVVLEEAGRTLSVLPLWTSIGAGRILGSLAAPDLGAELLAQVAAGTAIPGWIGLHSARTVEAAASASDGHVVNGRTTHVVGGDWMTQVLVIAKTADGLGLFLVPTDTAGVTVTAERAVDLTRQLVSMSFADAPATLLSPGPIETASLVRVRAEIATLLAAEQVGTAQGALDMAVAYAKTRQQFGRAIGSFQSLKHLLADAYVDVETARDTTRYAAWTLSVDREDPALMALVTRAGVTPRAQRVCATALQVFGGIGYTWEHDAHLYYRRALSAAHLLTEVNHDLDGIADTIGLADELP
ncbi:acyl-CoA dehydrogenase [Nocardioides immobilis]|uniref:Acyl-CoA dehydrogenase n=1 Tax=Nocardioides immobilis TaxID=2049295 RepID=A0A417Y0Y9_9ACTN|nr:acyl-CoA dehydrogenase family protein [Nocardioides immobilis]RHW26251.1 acyl-CoA dehydrogenase [Nocardioides immobilis]